MPRYELAGKVAIVTGAGRGIGRAIALRLAREEAGVACTDLNEAWAKRVAAEIEAAGGEALAMRVDVTQRADAERMVSETVSRFGRLDILVNNAGIGVCTSLPTTPHLVVGRSACRVGVGPSLNRSWAQRSRPVVQAGRRAFPGDESVVD